jgi:hypothetical protein
MRAITQEQLLRDLEGWLGADATAIQQARRLQGGGGWEQWCIIQFLRWQLNAQPPGIDFEYQRELSLWSGPVQRRFDIGYNYESFNARQAPLILTQWKAGNNGNYVSSEVTRDLGTLTEFSHFEGVEPLIVALCPEKVNFPGVAESGPVDGTNVRIYVSTPQTWQMVGGLQF